MLDYVWIRIGKASFTIYMEIQAPDVMDVTHKYSQW